MYTSSSIYIPPQHNKKREELHRLKEKYPEQAARLERQVNHHPNCAVN